jgi:agmatinase
MIHFDAHTDLRRDYLGVELSHACVIRRCWEILGDGRIHQFGIRSGEKEEFDWAKSGHTDFHPFTLDGLEQVLDELKGKPVYFTLDLDVMDPSVFPGTGTPEPGGVDFLTAMKGASAVCGRADIIGCDVTELCPPCDPTGASTAAACKIVREMLIALAGQRKNI